MATKIENTQFFKVLTRDNKQIQADRAKRIAGEYRAAYVREILDMQGELAALKGEQETMHDLSTSNSSTDINNIREFSGRDFVRKEKDLTISIEAKELDIATVTKAYQDKFGAFSPDDIIAEGAPAEA